MMVWAWERPAERNAVSRLKAASISSGSGDLPARRLYPHRNTTAGVAFNPLKPELNPISYLLALLGAHHFLHVCRIRVKSLTLR